MSHMIYEYALAPLGAFSGMAQCKIKCLPGAKPLFVAVKDGRFNVWMEVEDRGQPTVERTFMVYGTGIAMNIDRAFEKYVGSCIEDGFVWHVYDLETT